MYAVVILLFLFDLTISQFSDCPLGWQRAEVCGGIFCYYKIPVPPLQRPTAVEQNICQTVNPQAHVVSIHCDAENKFLAQYGKFVIGLHIKSYEPWTRNGFQWEDRTPLDFNGWSPDQPDNQLPPERNVEYRTNMQSFGWNDLPLIFFEAVVCKITLRPYGQINPVNPVYPYYQNPYSNPYQYNYGLLQQTPAPLLQFAAATQFPLIQRNNQGLLQAFAQPVQAPTPPATSQIIVNAAPPEQTVIELQTPVPG